MSGDGGINGRGVGKPSLEGRRDESAWGMVINVWGFICETDVFVQPGPHMAAAPLACQENAPGCEISGGVCVSGFVWHLQRYKVVCFTKTPVSGANLGRTS